MGVQEVKIAANQKELNRFTRFLLKDIQAMEYMLENDWFEQAPIRIGAEQEVCLVDEHGKPAPKSMEILAALNHPSFTTELSRFNIEANLSPVEFTGDCFSRVQKELDDLMELIHKTAHDLEARVILTGILPTIRKFDLDIENLTPIDRYYALLQAIERLRGKAAYELKIEGLDELNLKHDSALIEACNTSFQVHLQVTPQDFVSKYNIAQAISAPVLAVSSNSPMLFGKRLWNETRIALFQQSVDTRITNEHLRYTSPRVTFGNGWVKNSILDLYKEDIVRFKVLLTTDVKEDVLESVKNNKTPQLQALSIHNSTVYRWNRPCYGISPNGKPHLRIENRILPSGPTTLDEVANSAFWVGLMNGFEEAYPDVTKVLEFDDVKANFVKAARIGLGSKHHWVHGKTVNDIELIQKELLPIARIGLEKAKVNEKDIDKYLAIIEDRTETGMNGSRWILKSYSKLLKESTKEEATTAIVAGMAYNQKTKKPVHEWKLASIQDIADWHPTSLLVEEFMTTDIFTVSKDEIPEFSADMMDWRRIRYLPIENEQGELIGLITSRQLLRHFSTMYKNEKLDYSTIKDLMIKDPLTVAPEATIIEAIDVMNTQKIGCLPVVNNKKLVGIITESNFLSITSSLLKRLAAKKKKAIRKEEEAKQENNTGSEKGN
ncbi:CBS domain-containing protein [uncultured Microscilla sp.]|uniref:CBS domain-containing protein n=1 Tax=uncultured Microscilla sp. TaxID=432653 RepID=UPI00262047BE|nr:CBS domain-containing protein [uncultured Microscilla sp.]